MTDISPEDFEGAQQPAASASPAAPQQLSASEFENAPAAPPVDTGSAFENFRSAVAAAPGAIVGLPHVLAHTADWALAKGANALTGGNLTGADVDQSGINPIAKYSPTPEQFTNNVTYPAINAYRSVIGQPPVAPYEPKTPLGQFGNAVTTAATGGIFDPLASAGTVARLLNGGKAAVAGGVADVVKNLTGSDLAAAFSAFLAHAGASTAEGAARVGVPAAVQTGKSIVSPTAYGQSRAASTLAGVDNTAPPLTNPSDAALAASKGVTSAATGDIGPGMEPWQAGAELRNDLQGRVNDLTQARSTATDPIAAARDASTAQVNLDPVLSVIGKKLTTAAGAQKSAVQGALDDLKMPSGALRVNGDQLAASRQAINARVSAAKQAGDNATVSHLMDIRGALDQQVNAAVPEAGQFNKTFADMSRPLDPTQYGPVAKVLDRDQFNSRYTFPDERIPDLFLKSQATKSDLDQLTDAFGGDRARAQAALEQHLAGKVQGAINPDGTLDQAGFAKAVQPYQKALVWFPDLAKKFQTAQTAQNTYEGLLGQRQVADSINNGGLRDTSGNITPQSYNSWLRDNRDLIAKAHGLPTVMRLQQIGNAMKAAGPSLADTVTGEIAPVVAGAAFGGTEGGILGGMLHNATKVVTAPIEARRNSAFNAAIERAVQDPAAAQRLAATVSPAARLSGTAVKNAFVRALTTATRTVP